MLKFSDSPSTMIRVGSTPDPPNETSSSGSEYLSRRGPEFEYEWQIENFSMCPQSKGQALESTSFTVDSLDKSEFKLVLYPRGQEEDGSENITCFLECLNQADYSISVVIAVLGTNKSVIATKAKEFLILRNGGRIGFVLLSDRQELVTREFFYVPDDVFTIRCVLSPLYHAPFACDEDLLSISRDYSSLLESGNFSDFVIKGSEGETYKVHKIILTVRSYHLAKKLGLLEDEPVSQGYIYDMNPAVLRAVLYYLYSGNLMNNLTPDVLSEVYEAAKRYNMDDLERDIFPLETHTTACTITKVDRRTISWGLKCFESLMDAGAWPIRTFVDLTHGRFVISFSVTMGSNDKPLVQIDIYSQSLMVDGNVLVKCDVLVDHGEGGPNPELCSGQHFFDLSKPETRTFSMTGDPNTLYIWRSVRQYPEMITLIFRFTLSTTGTSSECRIVEVNNSFAAHDPVFNRSYQRLSSDLDMVFRDTIDEVEPHDMDWDPGTFSDLRIRSLWGKFIRAHKCVLAARSSEFRKLLENGNIENLERMCDKTLKHLLSYAYSGKIKDTDIDVDTVLELYDKAIKYKFPVLVKRCIYLLTMKVTSSNMYRILLHSENDNSLFRVVQQFILRNRTQVLSSEDWLLFRESSTPIAIIALSELPEDQRFLQQEYL